MVPRTNAEIPESEVVPLHFALPTRVAVKKGKSKTMALLCPDLQHVHIRSQLFV